MLGERIAILRRCQGWSQADLACRLHISPSAVGMYEQGRREPSLEALVAMSELFGVSADYLLTGRLLLPQDQKALSQAQKLLPGRKTGARFTREELAVLFAAMLTEA